MTTLSREWTWLPIGPRLTKLCHVATTPYFSFRISDGPEEPNAAHGFLEVVRRRSRLMPGLNY